MDHYGSSLQHILAELERIDLLIQLQVNRARLLNIADEQFQGLVITEEEVDALLGEPAGLPHWATSDLPLGQPKIQAACRRAKDEVARKKEASRQRGVTLRLDQLQRLFGLTNFELDVLLVCLAPEIDLRYERLFGYLQDDVTKRRPSVDLVLNLLSPTFEEKLAARHYFTHTAPLLRFHLLQLFDDPSHVRPPLLSRYLKLDERIVGYLFDGDEVDARLRPYVQIQTPQTPIDDLLLPADLRRRLVRLSREQAETDTSLIFYFQGSYGLGRRETAAALCREMGRGLLVVDGAQLLESEGLDFETAVRLVQREARLQHAVIYWRGFDALLADERRAWRTLLLRILGAEPGLVFLAGEPTWEPADEASEAAFVRVEFPRPDIGRRVQFWQRALAGSLAPGKAVDLEALAGKFRFSGGQICDAARTARSLARWRDPENGHVTADDLYAASRLQSNRKLAEMAQKITPHYTWGDIVLPPDRLEQLREIVNQMRYRAKVYEEWGFDRKLAMGKGLNALFAGPSGTGKTMAAEIMAHELGLDLYKIDLSSVVSKYIGETEKNLARIFREAESSNAILFFDEADALFGKRSEVRDAHDRYANIEISYLLQKMEEYEGMVILATNLHKNMDDAFVRRMHFTVEFPFPSVRDRRRIWQQIWPAETPLAVDDGARQPPDLDFMAQRFEIAGGNIRNIALAAAFLAASDGEVVDMEHLLRATRREYQKMGKVMVDGEFGDYATQARRVR